MATVELGMTPEMKRVKVPLVKPVRRETPLVAPIGPRTNPSTPRESPTPIKEPVKVGS